MLLVSDWLSDVSNNLVVSGDGSLEIKYRTSLSVSDCRSFIVDNSSSL